MKTSAGWIFLLALSLCLVPGPARSSDAPKNPGNKGEWVILLHGLGRTERSMKKVAARLQAAGYSVLNRGYPSTKHDIQTLSDVYVTAAVRHCRESGAGKIHFVTHSLGGILVRKYLSERPMPDLGRIAMMSPPNRGSEVADKMKGIFFYKWFMGPAGQELGTDACSVPNTLPARVPAEVGVITGSKSSNPWFSHMIPGPDDGKVSVERARLENMADFLIVDCGHTSIMKDPGVIRQVLIFLEKGRFDHTP